MESAGVSLPITVISPSCRGGSELQSKPPTGILRVLPGPTRPFWPRSTAEFLVRPSSLLAAIHKTGPKIFRLEHDRSKIVSLGPTACFTDSKLPPPLKSNIQ